MVTANEDVAILVDVVHLETVAGQKVEVFHEAEVSTTQLIDPMVVAEQHLGDVVRADLEGQTTPEEEEVDLMPSRFFHKGTKRNQKLGKSGKSI